jgi:thiamine biosynthesis lipoprotein
VTIQPPADAIGSVLARVRESVRVETRGDFYLLTLQAMSTPVRMNFRAGHPALAQDCRRAAIDWLATFEARYSRFIPQSIIGQINASAGGDWIDVDDETEELFALCDKWYRDTDGVFDAAALPLLRVWNWKADPPVVPAAATIAAARQLAGWDKVQRRPRGIRLPTSGMGIDLGGIGKEFAVDHLMEMARERNFTDVLVDIGQDVRVHGRSPGKEAWYIGLEEPDDPGKCWSCVAITDRAVATSGDYLRSFTHEGRRYGHILDPRSGEPVSNGCQAVTVIALTCVTAGILSTSAFILGPQAGLDLILRHSAAEACISTHNARYQTRRFSTYVTA